MSLLKALKGIHKQLKIYNHYNQTKNHELPSHEKHGTTSDKISVAVNSLLAILTVIAIFLAYQANKTSQKALLYSQEKDSLENIEQQKKDKIDSSERVASRNYVDSTLSISQQSVAAAIKSYQIADSLFNQTKKGIIFSRQSSMIELRAYEVLSTPTLKNFNIDSLFAIEAEAINVGKTPAYKYRCSIGFALTGKNITEQKVISLSKGSVDTATSLTMGASQVSKHYHYYTQKLTAEFFYGVMTNNYTLFSVIIIEYEDVFNQPHFTHGFFRYIPEKNRFIPCKIFNDSN